MKLAIIGLGIQGRKRMAVAGDDVTTTVDPVQPGAQFARIEDVPLDGYDAACVCTPDDAKVPLLEYLLSRGKHVMVEKPLLALDGHPIRRLAEAARGSAVACYTAYNHRFEPHLVRLKRVVDSDVLGEVYLARFFYGNGTARDVRNSPWRDRGLGVLPDLGSHLLDTALFLLGRLAGSPEAWSLNRFENRAFDHVLFGFGGRPVIEMEATLVSWRNTFYAELFGERGSAHVHGLCKWGPSTFTLRTRALPSGRPHEEVETLEQPDPTWAAEYEHFQALCGTGGTNLENDLVINEALNEIGRAVGQGLRA